MIAHLAVVFCLAQKPFAATCRKLLIRLARKPGCRTAQKHQFMGSGVSARYWIVYFPYRFLVILPETE